MNTCWSATKIATNKLLLSALVVLVGTSPAHASQVKDAGALVLPSPSAKAWSHTREQFDKCKFQFAGAMAAVDTPQEIRAARNMVNNYCSCVVNKMAEVWDAYGRDNMPTLLRLMRNGGEDIDRFSNSCNAQYIKPYINSSSSPASRPSSAGVASRESQDTLAPTTIIQNRYPFDCGSQPSKFLFDRCMQNL